jgi:YidC/Oxa1 family membrane protein insertase
MDWKILIIALVVLTTFFLYQKCGEPDSADYDRIQARERAQRSEANKNKNQMESRRSRQKAVEEARAKRGKRPEPKMAVLTTNDFKATFTSRGAALQSFILEDPQYLEAPRDWQTGLRNEDSKDYVPVDLVTTNTKSFELSAPLRLEMLSGMDNLIPEADYEIIEADDRKVVFSYTQPDLPIAILKKFELTEQNYPYQLWLTIKIKNKSDKKVSFRAGVSQHGYQHDTEAKGSVFSKQPNLLQGICLVDDEVFISAWNDEKLEQPFSGIGNIKFVGVQTNYFIGAMVPYGDVKVSCHLATKIDNRALYPNKSLQPWGHVVADLRFAETELLPGESTVFKIKNYLGPKRYRLMQATGHHLEESVDFGMLWPICQVLLSILFFFQGFLGNWGVSIILLTVVVKVVLMPLTHKSFQSAEKMKALKPQVDELNEKYKDDAQAKQQATMALYKQNKVNPLGGCIPSLLQMPIWFALFKTLRSSPELYRAPFFGWITDLSNPDPYFVTPILMGAMMFLQQKFTPMTGDSAQAKMMLYFMPIMFTAMMLFLPSGLTLYILVNTVLSIGHQLYIHRRSTGAAVGK